MKTMIVRIKRDGKTEIRVEGGQGDDCLAFTRSVEKAVGEVESRVRCDDEDPLRVQAKENIVENV